MGVLEPRAAEAMGVPRGLAGHRKAVNAFHHLSSPSLFSSLGDAEAGLIERIHGTDGDSEDEEDLVLSMMQNDLQSLARDRALYWRRWRATSSSSCSSSPATSGRWAAEYVTPRRVREESKSRPSGGSGGGGLGVSRARMMWGNMQEATAVLCSINVMHAIDPDAVMLECGMFPGEALLDSQLSPAAVMSDIERRNIEIVAELQRMGCRIGASPDGLMVRKAPGSATEHIVEVVEVKNHSPFMSVRKRGGGVGGGAHPTKAASDERDDKTIIRDRAPPAEIPPWYVPQLMLEMFCVGQHCRSALLVRLTATKGATIMRLPRDDSYITLMLERALRFYKSFVLRKREPTVDFGNNPFVPFYDSESDDAEDDFSVAAAVEFTMRVAKTATVVDTLEHRQVQRAGHAKKFEPLLL